jgi:hypothetical protein
MTNEVFCKVLAHNVCCLIQACTSLASTWISGRGWWAEGAHLRVAVCHFSGHDPLQQQGTQMALPKHLDTFVTDNIVIKPQLAFHNRTAET